MGDQKVTRRNLLKTLAITAAGAVGVILLKNGRSQADVLPPQAYLPYVEKDSTLTPTPTRTRTPTRTGTATRTSTVTRTATNTRTPTVPYTGNTTVVHVHAPSVTNWNFGSSYYGETQTSTKQGVNQNVVNDMVDNGVSALFGLGASEYAQAWGNLLPGYAAGKRIAIKINLNNTWGGCSLTAPNKGMIDAIAQPVNAVIRGLIASGARPQDIIVFDGTRAIPTFVSSRISNTDIMLYDWASCSTHSPCTYNSTDPQATVHFSPPGFGAYTSKICDVIMDCTYLINMPIMKGHGGMGVSLGFKNHLGSIPNPQNMHDSTAYGYAHINTYSGLIPLNAAAPIKNKTILTIGDGIYGSNNIQDSAPQRWVTFGSKAPSSMFFSTDRLAIDCVMYDFLKAERGSNQDDRAGSYLHLAQTAGLGTYDTSTNPFSSPNYTKIDYRRINL